MEDLTGHLQIAPKADSARRFWLLARAQLDGVHYVDNDRDQHEDHIQTQATQQDSYSWREPNPSPVDPFFCSDKLVLFKYGQDSIRPVSAVRGAGVGVRNPLGPSIVRALHSSHLDQRLVVNRVLLPSA